MNFLLKKEQSVSYKFSTKGTISILKNKRCNQSPKRRKGESPKQASEQPLNVSDGTLSRCLKKKVNYQSAYKISYFIRQR